MPIYRDKSRGAFVFEFDRIIPGAGRVRARKRLPRAWNQAQADAFDRQESARLYAIATGAAGTDHLIEDAVASYVKERVPQLKSGYGVAAELAGMYWAYAGRPLSALADVCRAYRLTAQTAGGRPLAPATVRNRLRYLIAACRWGWREHRMGGADPAAAIRLPPVRNERRTYIGRADMLRVARSMRNRQARMAVRIAFYSGMRLGEILRAEPIGTAWVLRDTKNGQPRIVPIHPRAAVCARRFDRQTPKITIQQAWLRTRRRIQGMQEVHFHDLRHSAASELINAGMDLYTVGRVLGHRDPRSTQRYAHLAVGTMADAIRRIGQKNPATVARRAA